LTENENNRTADNPRMSEPCILAQIPCIYYQQAMQTPVIPLFWKMMAVFHAIVVIIFAFTLFTIAGSLTADIAAERATRDAVLNMGKETHNALTQGQKELLNTVQSHQRLTLENRTFTSQILGILLKEQQDLNRKNRPK
jgi:hypothetical protein